LHVSVNLKDELLEDMLEIVELELGELRGKDSIWAIAIAPRLELSTYD
jgi:hypothetical protein